MAEMVTTPNEGWDELALCRGLDAEWFFSDDEAAQYIAKQQCASCPVRQDCYNYAMSTGEWEGVWGGLSGKSRWHAATEIHGTSRRALRGCNCSPCTDAMETRRDQLTLLA